ncbi:MAG: hypothetical protein IH589_04530 [Anaerolineales bacterium]|nr:hypothetical protein [Anaerolineales bacterium]
MNVWADGLSVIVDRAWVVFSIFATIIWGQVLIVAPLRKHFRSRFTNAEYASLGMAGWILPVAFGAVLLFAGSYLFGDIAELIFTLLAVTVFISALVYGKSYQVITPAWMPIFLISVILQFSFLDKTILPLYFDSAEHYRIIKFLTGYYELTGSGQPLINYYHVGFHFISAAVAHLFQLGIVDIMLVFGQAVLVVLPFSLFFIIKQETQSNMAAAFACLLAGIGWHMPAHLVNWGKYPALFSLPGILFVFSIGYLLFQNKKSRPSILYLLMGFGILISVLIHSRSLVVFFFSAISLYLTFWRKRLPPIYQHLVFGIVLFIFMIEIGYVHKSAALSPLLDGYLRNDLWMIILAAALTLFSIRFFTDLTFLLFASLSFLVLGLFVPVHLPGFGTLTLLDRPYVQMLFYLPLSIFGGLGLAGLYRFLQGFYYYPKQLTRLAAFLMFGFVILNAMVNHDFYPSDCCQIVSRDDLTALQWMDKTLPSDVSVLIASADLFVTSFESPAAQAGVDGGVWISALISRKTFSLPGEADFYQSQTHAEVCKLGADYIYAGGMPQSFNVQQLDEQDNWYLPVFSLPAVKIYRVNGCE